MNCATELSVPSEFDLEKYLTQMELPDTITPGSPDPERRNLLNESFEDRCELTQVALAFIQSLHPRDLPKIQRFIFNQMTQQRVLFLRKVILKQSKLPVCLGLLFRMSKSPGKTIIVFRKESKGRGYFNKLRELNPVIKNGSYFSTLGSMIMNDKRALQKPHSLLAFPLPRLVNLISHKSLELQSVSFILFVDADQITDTQPDDFAQFVDLHRQRGREIQLAFIANSRPTETTSALSDSFGNLTVFENRTP